METMESNNNKLSTLINSDMTAAAAGMYAAATGLPAAAVNSARAAGPPQRV